MSRPAGPAEDRYPLLPAEDRYPLLTAGQPGLAGLLAQVRAATAARTAQIDRLRRQLRDTEGDRLAACARAMAGRFAAGGRLLAFGSGGSAADAGQLATLFLRPGPGARPLPALSLAADAAVLTALASDTSAEVAFARQIAAFGRPADIAVGLSTSGNSASLLAAFAAARGRGLLTVGLAGYTGGQLAGAAAIDYLFVAPSASVHRICEAQATLCQVLWELCRDAAAEAGS